MRPYSAILADLLLVLMTLDHLFDASTVASTHFVSSSPSVGLSICTEGFFLPSSNSLLPQQYEWAPTMSSEKLQPPDWEQRGRRARQQLLLLVPRRE